MGSCTIKSLATSILLRNIDLKVNLRAMFFFSCYWNNVPFFWLGSYLLESILRRKNLDNKRIITVSEKLLFQMSHKHSNVLNTFYTLRSWNTFCQTFRKLYINNKRTNFKRVKNIKILNKEINISLNKEK